MRVTINTTVARVVVARVKFVYDSAQLTAKRLIDSLR